MQLGKDDKMVIHSPRCEKGEKAGYHYVNAHLNGQGTKSVLAKISKTSDLCAIWGK